MAREMVCTTCHHVGSGRTETKGSIIIELFLWGCFLVPGLLYSLWRLTSKQLVCRECKSSTLVPADSKVGKKIIGGAKSEDSTDTRACPYCAETIKSAAVVCRFCGKDLKAPATAEAG